MYCTQVCEMYCRTTLVYLFNNCLELNENVAKLSVISRPVRFLHIMYRYFEVHDFMKIVIEQS